MSSAEKDNKENAGERTTIGPGTKVTLQFVWSVVGILVPVIAMLLAIYRQQERLQAKFDLIVSDMLSMKVQVGDRWTRSMMNLFATELELRNYSHSNRLMVPNPDDIARRMPASGSK